MKKIRIAFTVLAGSLLFFTGCQIHEENGIEFTKPGSDEIVFSMPATRSAVAEPQGTTTQIRLTDGTKDLGLILEETVVRLDAVSGSEAITRATPAYTENVASLYGAFNAVVYDKNNAEKFADGAFTYADEKWTRRFYQDPWQDVGEDPLYFYMRMPGDDDNVTGLEYAIAGGKQAIHFNYTSPATATAQNDILFAARSLTKSEYQTALDNKTYPDVLFHHALTGIKFANYFPNTDDNTKTVITKITFSGLIDKGTCIVTPREETDGYVDDKTGDYSSADGITVVWSDTTRTGDAISQTFDEAFAEYSSEKLPESFTGKNTKQNLNDANATKTFWIVPQKLTADMTVKVDFTLKYVKGTSKDTTLTLKLGELLKENSLEWKAGELRTYTLKPEVVDVEITDKMDTYKYKKSDVVIENTGNVDQYVRVYMIGNWVGLRQIKKDVYNDYETVLMGYTDTLKNEHGEYVNNIEVARWNDKDFTWVNGEKVYPKWESPLREYDYTPYGVFDGLPAMGTATEGGELVRNWRRHDKFYYYTKPIGPGATVPDTYPLFYSYEIDKSPEFFIADNTGVRRKAKDVHFVMDLMVQAIGVPLTEAGDTVGYEAAWKAALPADNLNDL